MQLNAITANKSITWLLWSRAAPRTRTKPLAGLHLIVGERRIFPVVYGLRASFQVPKGARNIVIVSNSVRPCDLSDAADMRKLGVCIEEFIVDDGKERFEIPLDHPRLWIGFHDLEDGSRRWTTGRTPLANDLFAAYENGFTLRLRLAGQPLAR